MRAVTVSLIIQAKITAVMLAAAAQPGIEVGQTRTFEFLKLFKAFIKRTCADGGVVMATAPLPPLSQTWQATKQVGGAVALPGAGGRPRASVTL